MAKEKLRESILDAAQRVLAMKGLVNATMEDIAKEAGLSKGGVFYHFASKKELLLGIIERYESVLYEVRARIYNELPEQPSRKLKATFLALIEHPSRWNENAADILSMLSDNDMRSAISAVKKRLVEDVLIDAPDPHKAVLAMIISDGVWLSEMFDVTAYPARYVAEVMSGILASLEIVSPKIERPA